MSAPSPKTAPGTDIREVRPKSAEEPSESADEPAQGRVDTQTRYRDRPTDDGKHGDADAEPRQEAER